MLYMQYAYNYYVWKQDNLRIWNPSEIMMREIQKCRMNINWINIKFNEIRKSHLRLRWNCLIWLYIRINESHMLQHSYSFHRLKHMSNYVQNWLKIDCTSNDVDDCCLRKKKTKSIAKIDKHRIKVAFW